MGGRYSGVTVRDTNGSVIPARIGRIICRDRGAGGQPGGNSRVALANNIIPAALINPVASPILAYYPEPNVAGSTNPRRAGIQQLRCKLDSHDKQLPVHRSLDYGLTQTQQVFVRVIKDHDLLFNSGPFPTSIASPQPNPEQTSVPGSIVVNYVNAMSSRTVLHLNAGATRFNNDARQFSDGFDLTTLGFPRYLAAASADARVFPAFNPNGYTALGPPRNFGNFRNNQDSFSLNQDMTASGRPFIQVRCANALRMYNYRPDDPSGNTHCVCGGTPVSISGQ